MKKLFCLLLAVLMIVTLAGCGKQARLENQAENKVEAMLNALENGNLEEAEKLLHPVSGKDAEFVAEDLQELVQLLENKKVTSFTADEVEANERSRAKWIVKGTGTITLSDGTEEDVSFSYLSDGSSGFVSFKIRGVGVSV